MNRKTFHKILGIVLLLTVILSACAPTAQPTTVPAQPTTAASKPFKAGYVQFQTNPFYDDVSKGLKEAVDAAGGTLLIQTSAGDLKKELAIVEDFLSQKIDVLFISMTDPVGSAEAVRKANDAGVPVIAVALGPDPAQNIKVVTFIRSNDYKAASEVAEYILKQINYEGDVVLVDGPQVSVVLERMKAYKDVIAKYPNVKVAGQAMKEEVSIPANATLEENLLTAAPNAKAMFVYAGYGIPAAATVLKNLNKPDVWVGEIDGLPEEIKPLADGIVKGATAKQQPYIFGKEAVATWLKYQENPSRTDIPAITEIPTQLITNDNAKDFLK